jgi:hypothetical protein
MKRKHASNEETKLCNSCGKPGHTQWKCPRPVCTQCEEAGHIAPQCNMCTHCRRQGHAAKACTFGLNPDERFLLCGSTACQQPCFPRRFMIVLNRARLDFQTDDLRASGRADVGTSCTSSALFRSQSMRQNSQAPAHPYKSPAHAPRRSVHTGGVIRWRCASKAPAST